MMNDEFIPTKYCLLFNQWNLITPQKGLVVEARPECLACTGVLKASSHEDDGGGMYIEVLSGVSNVFLVLPHYDPELISISLSQPKKPLFSSVDTPTIGDVLWWGGGLFYSCLVVGYSIPDCGMGIKPQKKTIFLTQPERPMPVLYKRQEKGALSFVYSFYYSNLCFYGFLTKDR